MAGNLELIVFVEYSIAKVMMRAMLWMSSSDNQSLVIVTSVLEIGHDLFVNS